MTDALQRLRGLSCVPGDLVSAFVPNAMATLMVFVVDFFVAFLMGTLSTDQRNGSPLLIKLNGHGELYKWLVADFVGIIWRKGRRNREMRNTRELAEHVTALGLGQ